MDDWQLQNVAFRPGVESQLKKGIYEPVPVIERELVVSKKKKKKKKKGSLLCRKDPTPTVSGFQAIFWETWRRRGLSEDEIQKRFEEARA